MSRLCNLGELCDVGSAICLFVYLPCTFSYIDHEQTNPGLCSSAFPITQWKMFRSTCASHLLTWVRIL